MAIDYWELSKDFETGDTVQLYVPGTGMLSPYVGAVIQSLPSIGFVDVKWPFGVERVSPEELVKSSNANLQYVPPSLTLKDMTNSNVKLASYWEEPSPDFYLELAPLFHKGASALEAYDTMWSSLGSVIPDVKIKTAVARFYRVAEIATQAFLGEYAAKTAAYWASKDRKYRATQQELEVRKITCPSCKGAEMKRTVYKMEDGVRARLMACPKCLYLVKQSDILSPDGSSVEW